MTDWNTQVIPPGSIAVHSQVQGPIEDYSFLEQSLLFAELASLAYYDPGVVERPLAELGFSDSQFFDRDGAQAWIFANDQDCIVACRGTESNEWNDIRADVNAIAVVTETFGRVHRGFKDEVDDLWPRLEDALKGNDRRLWFTGHSLGGAMATICAGRCFLSEIDSLPYALYTYGSPRVGDKRFVNFVELNHTRWVNNNDIVTRVPPVWMGYRHSGREMYLDRHGAVRTLNGVQRVRDRARGFLAGLLRFRIDHFADHSMDQYIRYIRSAVEAQVEESHSRAS
jgi:triacylglycerol lipase